MAGVGTHLEAFPCQLLDALGRGLFAPFELQAVAFGVEQAPFCVGAFELGGQAARIVLDVDQIQRAGHRQQQDREVEPRHCADPARPA